MSTRTLDTDAVLSHASATVQRLTRKGRAQYTFTTTTPAGELVSRKATAAEKRSSGHAMVTTTPEEAAAARLRPVATSSGWSSYARKGFTAPTGKTIAPIGAWVTVDGTDGQVWSEGSTTGTVWVALVTGAYVETSRPVLAPEPAADVLPLDVPTVDLEAARDLEARAEASGRDGVAFVRRAMGDAAADALEGAPSAHARALATIYGVDAEDVTPAVVEPVERVVTDDQCALCGTPVDAVGVDTDGTVWCDEDTRHVVAADAPRGLPIGQAVTYAAPTSGMPDQRLTATVLAHAVVGPARIACTRVQAPTGYTWWVRPVQLTPVQAAGADFADRMHALRRAHRHLQAWRMACAV